MNKIDFKLKGKCGIYSIKNVINNKRYIGSSKNLYNRLHEHLHNLKYKKSHNRHLQSSWDKYGEDNFEYSILEFCEIDKRFIREQYYLDIKMPEYNFATKVIAFEGRIVPEETRRKISETLKRKYANKEIQVQKSISKYKKCYIYDIEKFSLISEFENSTEALLYLNKHKDGGYDKLTRYIHCEKYIVSIDKFHNEIDLINYLYSVFYKLRNSNKKYLITEKINGELIYHKNKKDCIILNNLSISILDNNINSTKENPYLPKSNNNKVYFSDIFYPIKEAVLKRNL